MYPFPLGMYIQVTLFNYLSSCQAMSTAVSPDIPHVLTSSWCGLVMAIVEGVEWL
jgi:hypothetical protein